MIKVVCWNIAAQKRSEVRDVVFGMDADVAVLQEVESFPRARMVGWQIQLQSTYHQIPKNVPTFALHKKAENAVDQLDYVFASRDFHEFVQTRAFNHIDEWGPSDHCRILIEVN